MTSYKKGFTLIELLVVIAIIGILSSIVLAVLSEAKKKAEDAKFVSDAHQLQNALELYKSDTSSYPGEDNPNVYADIAGYGFDDSYTTLLEPLLVPKYISILPHSPHYPDNYGSASGQYYYLEYIVGTNYFKDNNFYCGRSKPANYAIVLYNNAVNGRKLTGIQKAEFKDNAGTFRDISTNNPDPNSPGTYCLAQ